MLDLISKFAGPEVQVEALNVLSFWRPCSISLIKNYKNLDQFRSPSSPNQSSVLSL